MVSIRIIRPIWYIIYTCRPPNVALLRALWSPLVCVGGIVKGIGGVLVVLLTGLDLGVLFEIESAWALWDSKRDPGGLKEI